MTENSCNDEHEQVSLLLPWYVNNTLTGTEVDIVRHHISVCNECMEDITFLTSVQSSMAKGSPSPILPAADPASLLASLDDSLNFVGRRTVSIRRTAVIATLAATLAALAVVFTYQERAETPVARFETATSTGEIRPMDYVLNIAFTESAGQVDQERTLKEIDARSVSSERDAGIFRVTVTLQISNMEDLERYTEALESLPTVQSVEVVAMQLPLSAPR
jgi:hypothetical protein